MEDVLEQPTSEPLTVEQVIVSPEAVAQPKNTDNIVQNHKRLSLIAQIFNWQPTPVSIRITLPIESRWQLPIIALEVTPFWIPLPWFIANLGSAGSRRGINYLCAKPWHFPVGINQITASAFNPAYCETPSGINVIEKDNMPFISWLALNHAGHSGEIDYMFRIISNVTTQGKVSFSRVYNAQRFNRLFNPNLYRTPFSYGWNSISTRKHNSFMILDLSRTSDMEVNCPYMDAQPYRKTADVMYNRTDSCVPSSYIVLDVVDVLDSSAGANEFIIDIWIKAGQDFNLIHPEPPRFLDSLYVAPYQGNTTNPARCFIDDFVPFKPLIYGRTGSNVTILEDDATIPLDLPAAGIFADEDDLFL